MIRTSLIQRQIWHCLMNIGAWSGISAMHIWICNIYSSLLVMKKDSNENNYCDVKVKIFTFLNTFLNEVLFLELVIVLFIFSAIWIYEYCIENYPRILWHMALMSENRHNILVMLLVTLLVFEIQSFRVLNAELSLGKRWSVWTLQSIVF
jgi:hypothetical protein